MMTLLLHDDDGMSQIDLVLSHSAKVSLHDHNAPMVINSIFLKSIKKNCNKHRAGPLHSNREKTKKRIQRKKWRGQSKRERKKKAK